MKILSVEFKNFNSYGNKVTTLEFNDTSKMIMLIGPSGHGKSSLREVISYLAYGKVQDKKLSDLVNRINGNLWGKIKLVANKRLIEIERGIKPSIFNVWVDGEPLETAGKSNIQEELETEYYKIPQSTFDNIISISVDKFKSFLTMKPKDKRAILDQIFGTVFFNKVNDKLKETLREYNNKIENIEGQISVLENSKVEIEEKIKSLDKSKSEQLIKRANELTESISKLSNDFNEFSKKSKRVEELKKEADKLFKEHRKCKIQKETELKGLKEKISIYDSDRCPECGSDLCTDEHQRIKDELLEKKKDLEGKISEINENIKSVQERVKKVDVAQKSVGDKIFNVRIELSNLNSEKEKVTKEQAGINNDFTDVLENTIIKINTLLSDINTLKSDAFVYGELVKVFGEEGVKTQIMRNFLPSFNKNIQEYSRKLHFPYKITIDEKFDTLIMSIGEEINAKTLSTGERKKADFAVLVSLIKIMKNNFPSMNLLKLDEIFASLDGASISEVLTIVKELSEELGLTVFTVNHSELPSQYFDYVYEVQKVAGFSELTKREC